MSKELDDLEISGGNKLIADSPFSNGKIMREIKLRAWDELNKEMVYPNFTFGMGGRTKSDILGKFEKRMLNLKIKVEMITNEQHLDNSQHDAKLPVSGRASFLDDLRSPLDKVQRTWLRRTGLILITPLSFVWYALAFGIYYIVQLWRDCWSPYR